MLTKKQVQEIKPEPFTPVLAYHRFKDQRIVPNTSPRLKKEWSFDGNHSVILPDGSTVLKQGSYVPKMARQ